jgi:hypothetical protein
VTEEGHSAVAASNEDKATAAKTEEAAE